MTARARAVSGRAPSDRRKRLARKPTRIGRVGTAIGGAAATVVCLLTKLRG